jgi:hypothetical protein
MKYRIYLILKEVEEKYKPFLIQEFKEATTFDDIIVDQIYLETLTNKVPTWLWIEKTIADIKTSVLLVPARDQGALISIDKPEERKKIIESAFVNFSRKALLVCPEASEQLFNTILDDYELEFLHTSCFYLKSCCDEVRDLGCTHDHTSEDLLDCQFDIRDLLSLRIESEALEALSNPEKILSKIKSKKPKKREPVEVIEINGSISKEELSSYLSEKITELFKNANFSDEDEEIKYVVKKVFTNTDISTDIKTCRTEEEAEEFIEKIKREYPELNKTCNFIVCRTKKNEKED